MHYKDGTEAKVFDRVKGKMYGPDGFAEREGVLVSITPGCISCNGQVAAGDIEHLGGASIKVTKDDGLIVWKQAILIGHGDLNTMTIGELELVERVKNPPKVGSGG